MKGRACVKGLLRFLSYFILSQIKIVSKRPLPCVCFQAKALCSRGVKLAGETEAAKHGLTSLLLVHRDLNVPCDATRGHLVGSESCGRAL